MQYKNFINWYLILIYFFQFVFCKFWNNVFCYLVVFCGFQIQLFYHPLWQ
jgi:hypothetical protein